MNAKQVKPFVVQAAGALSLALASKPLVLLLIHLIEGVILQALDDGTLDEVVARGNLAARDDDPAA